MPCLDLSNDFSSTLQTTLWCDTDGDNKLTESLVVVEYLDAKYGGEKPILPRDPAELAKVCRHHLNRPYIHCAYDSEHEGSMGIKQTT